MMTPEPVERDLKWLEEDYCADIRVMGLIEHFRALQQERDKLKEQNSELAARVETLEGIFLAPPADIMRLVYPNGVSTPETYRHSWIENVMTALKKAAGLEPPQEPTR